MRKLLIYLCAAALCSPLVRAQTAPPAGPTIQQTIDFINEAFEKEGAFDYKAGLEHGVHVRYVGYFGEITSTMKVSGQSVNLSADGVLRYKFAGVMVRSDTSPPVTAKEQLPKGYDASKPVTPKVTTTDQSYSADIHLTSVKPKVDVFENKGVFFDEGIWTENDGRNPDVVRSTTPNTYVVTLTVPSSTTKGLFTTINAGWFFDQDLANRVAKAYAHAFQLLAPAEKPSIF